MLIFLPIHNSTPGLDTLAKALISKGSLPDHRLRIASTRDDEPLAFEIGDALSDLFKHVSTVTLPPLKRNAALLSNDMLKSALKWLREFQPEAGDVPDQPLLYMDPTFRPSERNWADNLQSEYFLKNAPPVMCRTESSGTGVQFRRKTIGPVIFGRKFHPPLLDFLDHTEHWRDRLVHEIAAVAVETRQIGAGGKSLLKPRPVTKVEA